MLTEESKGNWTDLYRDLFDFHCVLEYYHKKCAYVTNKPEWIWRILTSERFSRYPKKMNPDIRRHCIEYITECVECGRKIHIVIAGFPGKCANTKKVFHRTPDVGELAVLAQIDLLNQIVSLYHNEGIEITFLSDYNALKYTFFPNDNDIQKYISILKEWIRELEIPVDIVPAEKLFEEFEVNEKVFLDRVSSVEGFRQYIGISKGSIQLKRSIEDNMSIDDARMFYYQRIGVMLNDSDLVKASVRYYLDFWEKWNTYNVVQQYFGNIIYASPVAYHPDRRLCLRLQPSPARVAPWNGCGVVSNHMVYSLDERECINQDYLPWYTPSGYFLGYITK